MWPLMFSCDNMIYNISFCVGESVSSNCLISSDNPSKTNFDEPSSVEIVSGVVNSLASIENDKLIFTEQLSPNIAPDDVHTVFNYGYLELAVPLTDRWKLKNTYENNLLLGDTSEGQNCISFNDGIAKNDTAFAANKATASGVNSAGFNNSRAIGMHAFAANSGQAYGDYAVAVNAATTAVTPYSVALGNNAKT